MAKKKNSSSSSLNQFIGFVVVPLLALDVFAFWQIHKFTGGWGGLVVNLAAPLNQLAVLLMANIIIMICFMIIKK